MERIIRVTGKGKLAVKPDQICLSLNVTGVCREYGDALKESAEMTEVLRDTFVSLGFDPKDLKTVYFNVDTKYESVKVKDEWKQKFAGYEYIHDLKLVFDADNELLGRVLYAVAHCKAKPEFHFTFTVKDPERAKNELLKRACADARTKAEVLAAGAGVRLGDLQTIDYSWGTVEMEVRPVPRMLKADAMVMSNEMYDMNIEAEDIQIEDTVTMVWTIA